MSGGGRRPTRPGVMAGGGVGQGWVPGVNMPPLGYGLVAQQPHIAPNQPIITPAQQAWQQQQQHFMTQQTGLVGGPLGVPTLTQQQQQFPQHLQQQWLEAQRKAVEEQRKLYGQMVKQRQFDEQKMRLKAFGTSKKMGVSADTMIENILGGKEPSKQRSPQPRKKSGQSTQGNHQAAPTPQAHIHRQGTAVDWTKLENVNALFASPKRPATATPPAEHSANPIQPHQGTTTTALSSPQDTNSRAPGDTIQLPAASLNMGDTGSGRQDRENAVTLPQWMKDSATLPEVYKRAGGLVSASEGWVDTSRAYMLLMKTGLPPPLLGVLWEMVNCTTPGQLTQTEFSALLALVALVQSGQPITGPEVLGVMQEPSLPLIDHPALAPLVQDYLQARQQQHGVETGAGVGGTAAPMSSSITNTDDEFEDFVSVTVPPNSAMLPSQAPSSSSSSSVSSFPSQNPGGFIGPAQTAPQPPVEWPQAPPQATDKNRAMNLPKLGLSPEPSPATSFDDDFDDFQSASLPCIPQAAPATGGQPVMTNPARPTEQPTSTPLLQPEKIAAAGEDKYAVFREMVGVADQTADTTESADDSFGEFCSSEVAGLNLAQSTSTSALPGLLQCQSTSGTSNTSPISFEIYSTPPEALPDTQTDMFEADFSSAFASPRPPPDNYADIHEALRRAEAEQKYKEESKWSDPFGEFEEAPPPLPAATSTTAGVSGVGCGSEEEEDEDFGDFMGPNGGIGGGSSVHTLPPPLENLGETQSVASLELPGLEMTVGVDTSETLAIGSYHSPDLFLQPRGALEDQLSGLGLESAATAAGKGSISTTQHRQQQTATTTGNVMDPYCSSGGLVDKYSIIRQEASKDSQHHGEPHTGSWERCLEGSIKVLQEAHSILGSLSTTSSTANTSSTATTSSTVSTSLKSQVLATSQMQDYLANVHEVWLVCGRIRASSRRVTTSAQVDHLLSEAQTLWHDILAAAGADSVIAKPQVDTSATSEEGDNQMGEGEVCGVCLTGGGGRLTYGGHSYHPPCANLWLNRVDLLLPCLTPVTLL